MSRYNTVGSHKTKITFANGGVVVRYHQTDIVESTQDFIVLRTGGWKSNTTKLRMNQAANQFNLGYRVYQRNFEWYVDYAGQTLTFDGSELCLQTQISEAI